MLYWSSLSQCNQSCHQFVAKHTLMSFISGLGHFFFLGSYNDHTCFPFLKAVISELLATAPAHVDKHIWPERKVITCATFVVYVRSIIVFGYWPLPRPGLFLWKKAWKHSKEYFVSGCLKQGKVPGNGVFHTSAVEKAFSFRRFCPLTSTRSVAPGSYQEPSCSFWTLISKLFDFPPFPSLL